MPNVKLEDIGFYTLSDVRAKNSSISSPLYRCELLVTSRCNFHCPYCRSLNNGKDVLLREAERILNYWISEGLKNIRFSGGEPTLYKDLNRLVKIAKRGGVEHIAISTNGSNRADFYKGLVDDGVNDFSVSLDACCASTGDIMAGKSGAWKTVVRNIEFIASFSYVTVGIVLNEHNEAEAEQTILLAHDLGVTDIRIIPSAQYNHRLHLNIPQHILNAHPILKYRLGNKRHVRGMDGQDSRKCKLALDDMVAWNGNHYPCIIYLREGGEYQKPIGQINAKTRRDRFDWYVMHDSWENNICRKNGLDVCIAYNNKAIA